MASDSFRPTHRGICKYANGKCKQERTFKRNGGIHTLCEFHRLRACKNQRKLDSKRRQERVSTRSDDPAPKRQCHEMPYTVSEQELLMIPMADLDLATSLLYSAEADFLKPVDPLLDDLVLPTATLIAPSDNLHENGFWESEVGFLVSCLMEDEL